MKTTVFKGSGVALVTPFDKSGDNINFDKLGELLEYHINNNTDAIILCGTTGEASTLPDEQHMAAIEYAVDKIKGRIPLVAGTGSNDTAHAVMMTQFAQKAGADAVLCVTPYFAKHELDVIHDVESVLKKYIQIRIEKTRNQQCCIVKKL